MPEEFRNVIKQDTRCVVLLARMHVEGSSLLVERAQALKSDKLG